MSGVMLLPAIKSEIRISPDFMKWVETNPNVQMTKIQNEAETVEFNTSD